MAALLHGDPSRHEGGAYLAVQERIEESGGRWYFSRREIEEDSPSRRDGIDLKKETYLRKSYCTYLQDLGMRLKVPQVTIATAIIFCHRFFHRQSHVKNDRRTVATVCMFLAGKVEETPRPLKDVILVSYEVIHKKDGAAAIQRIKQKDVYEEQKEVILIAERVVLTTLAFDMNVLHPYKPLVEAIKKFKVAQNALAQVAWNFVNDGLRTSLCLQFKPHHIAAGAIFLAAKFLKVKLPAEGDKVWWQEFDVTPRQLEEVSNQMLELYEQNRVPATATAATSEAAEASGGGGGGGAPPVKEEHHHQHHHGSTNNGSSSSTKAGLASTSRTYSQPSQNGSIEGVKVEELNSTQNVNENEEEDMSVKSAAIKKLDKDKLLKVKAALQKQKKSRGDTKKTDLLDEDDLIERELEDGIEMINDKERIEDGELESFENPSPNRKRKAVISSPLEEDHKRQHIQENHV